MDRSPLTSFCPSFRVAPEPGQLFLSKFHRQVLDQILGRVDQGPSVIILTGDPGTGKTVLAQQIGLSSGRRFGRIGQSHAQLIDLHHQVPKALGIALCPAFDDPRTGPQAVADACLQAGEPVLLIVDEAQGLPDAGLDYLSALIEAGGEAGPISLLLVGGVGLEQHLANPVHDRLRARIDGRLRLQPFDAAETADYIAHRFRVSGCACHAGIKVFDPDGLQHLHDLSKGNPRVINHLVQSCLFEAGQNGLCELNGTFVRNCLSDMIQDGRLAHLVGPADNGRKPNTITRRDAPASPPPPAVPVRAATQRCDTRESAPRLRFTSVLQPGLAAALAGILILVPVGNPKAPSQKPVVAAGLLPLGSASPVTAMPPAVPRLPRRVVLQNSPDPEQLLAQALTLGGVDPVQAARLYTQAALWGSARAAYYLGQLYETGVGVEADSDRARGWYEAAADIEGAAARLAAMGDVPMPHSLAGTDAPVPIRHRLFRQGQTELHWRGPIGTSAPRFRVEYVPATGDGLVHHLDTSVSALLIPQPVARWRVMALDQDGTTGPASNWSSLSPVAR